MDILFRDDRLKRLCNERKKTVKKWGPKVAKKIRQRLDELHDAADLEVMALLQIGRFHELAGAQRGTFTLDVSGALRLVFEPAHEPVPRQPDGGIDLRQVTAVRILGVEDTHG